MLPTRLKHLCNIGCNGFTCNYHLLNFIEFATSVQKNMVIMFLLLFLQLVTGEKLWLDWGSNPESFADRVNTLPLCRVTEPPGHITNNFSP